MKLSYKNLRYLVYLIPIVLLAYLLWQNTRPVLEVNYNIEKKNPIVSELVPLSRTGEPQKDETGFYRGINKEPVYLDVKLPRKYHTTEVEIGYSDLKTDIFEIGVSRDETRKNFDFITLENKTLDNLKWNKLEKDGLVLYQKKNTYKSISEFLARPPKFNETLVYRANMNPEMKNFLAKGVTVFDFPIKEKIKFAFYHDGGAINLTFKGNYRINLFKDGKPVTFPAPGYKEGVYVIEIKGDKNFVLESGLRIGSPYVVILDSIKIGELKKPAKIYLAGSRLLARTESANGLQKLWTGGKPLEIKQAFTQYKKLFDDRNLKTVYIPKGNIELNGALFFAKPYNIFYPRYEVFYSGIDLNKINYILAKYTPPKKINNIKYAYASFNIKDTITPYNTLRYLLSLPGTKDKDLVKIRSIKIKLIGEKYNLKEFPMRIFRNIKKAFSF